jgi:Fur family ferric uptake transcriptional regulator
MDSESGFREILRQEGLKYTKQRASILRILTESEQPVSAEQVFMELQKNSVNANLSTVYRILESFASKSIVVKANIGSDTKALFEMNSSVHKHRMICMNCKRMTSIEGCPLEEYEKMLEEKMGFDVTGHKLEIYGYCEKCKVKNKKDGL